MSLVGERGCGGESKGKKKGKTEKKKHKQGEFQVSGYSFTQLYDMSFLGKARNWIKKKGRKPRAKEREEHSGNIFIKSSGIYEWVRKVMQGRISEW